jgi:glycerophosphoryl diester phosphodiesterase
MTHPYFAGIPTPRVLAHRGLVTPADEAEGIADNSFAAVASAHAAGARYVESDCHLTSDGEVVLFHDPHLTRVTGDSRMIADVTLAQLEDLMADRGGLITLAQALEAFPETRFNLDVKAAGAAEKAGMLVAPHAERVLLTSFSDERRQTALAAAARVRPEQRPATSAGNGTMIRFLRALLFRSDRGVARALEGVDALQVPESQYGIRVVSRRSVEAAHRNGVEVHVWTVNDPADMQRLVALGVDGIVTDRADVAMATLAS